ncbi:hypothetical protein SMACR_01252 [Sordaria macrospora]|uniref:WGS project CABT00000000 data, contig 2.4 n=2 Tax=Sordaria macrospora TaxID=5147 RepID=F7VQA3_SORMK|nr:uncharacterized protein SMAC_01252 [Sordaria macrospora k-hell]KAA8628607.1 hypothetical protein SMACR_01252 [Sordaria macrospora]WPJ58868.1 hypothetical protein SMAC4_01252 [Sordaria macrospora]CCC07685.1 unnamed protein product [Sordaria macrospora k-hell]
MVSFPEWTTHPIPGVSLSAGGLLALADLSTVAQRTAITGGSSWLDSLLLAPGLHYQQAADELIKWSASSATAVVDAGTGPEASVDVTGGGSNGQSGNPRQTTFRINNAATILYLQKIARPGQTVTLDVGTIPAIRQRLRIRRSESGLHATVWTVDDLPDLGWLSHVLYLISPVLTIAAIVLVILFQDWWTLAALLALMLSRILNIYIIKQRSKPRPLPSPPFPFHPFHPPFPSSHSPDRYAHKPANPITSLLISLSDDTHPCSIRLRGLSEDLYAIIATAWLRSKTHVEGYLEATAKLLVYMVAAFSGNMTQVGAMIMMVLLLATAGLLALSNANAKMFRVNGRVVVGEGESVFLGEDGGDGGQAGKGNGVGGGGGGEVQQRQRRRTGGLGPGVYPVANRGDGGVGYGNGNGNGNVYGNGNGSGNDNVIDAWPNASDTEGGRGYVASDNNWAEKGQAAGGDGDYGGM